MIRNTLVQWPVPTVKQSYEVSIKTPSSPTATPPEFGLTLADDTDGPAAWSAGSWSGVWSSTTELTLAITPTIGVSGSAATLDTLTRDRTYWVWARVTLGGEIWAEPVGAIRVP